MSDKLGTSTMGARHRSALGLAEETDAVVVVTSEESGDISVCFEGQMIHPVKPFELKSLIQKLLNDEELKDNTLSQSNESSLKMEEKSK
jgi:diadenylate cyclase